MDNIEQLLESSDETYIYLKDVAKYYWVEKKKFYSRWEVCSNLRIPAKDIFDMRWDEIKDYDGLCYKKWWKAFHYNLLSEKDILLPSDKPEIDIHIKNLISTIAWHSEENIDYLHKALLYKYTHINDYTVPAMVFYGKWWSGKSSFITLLSTIFWEDNVLWNLWQSDISGNFDTYKGRKIIVEFAEITTNSTHTDIRTLNKLKNMIFAEKIYINEKWVQVYQIDNIAWFFISSNNNMPIQLDDKSKWNRRFSVMKSVSGLENGEEVNQVIRDKDKVANYLAWLLQKYPEIVSQKSFPTLENNDKKELEERGQNEANAFWEWLASNHPEMKWKQRVLDINNKMDAYCFQAEIELYSFKKYFWKNSIYPKRNMRFWDKVFSWVEITS